MLDILFIIYLFVFYGMNELTSFGFRFTQSPCGLVLSPTAIVVGDNTDNR